MRNADPLTAFAVVGNLSYDHNIAGVSNVTGWMMIGTIIVNIFRQNQDFAEGHCVHVP